MPTFNEINSRHEEDTNGGGEEPETVTLQEAVIAAALELGLLKYVMVFPTLGVTS